jgi:hypothetical protein
MLDGYGYNNSLSSSSSSVSAPVCVSACVCACTLVDVSMFGWNSGWLAGGFVVCLFGGIYMCVCLGPSNVCVCGDGCVGRCIGQLLQGYVHVEVDLFAWETSSSAPRDKPPGNYCCCSIFKCNMILTVQPAGN